jgi:hypothetical protein
MRLRRFVPTLSFFAVAALPVTAHHSYSAEFNEAKPIRLIGIITEMEWVNPHCVIHVDVRNAEGSLSNWAVEGNSPNTLLRRGLTKRSIAPGTEVIVEGYQARNGSNTVAGVEIVFNDGRSVFLGSHLEWPWPPRTRPSPPDQ